MARVGTAGARAAHGAGQPCFTERKGRPPVWVQGGEGPARRALDARRPPRPQLPHMRGPPRGRGASFAASKPDLHTVD